MLSRFMTRREQLVLCFVAGSIILGSVVLLWKPSGEPTVTTPVAPGTEATPTATPPSTPTVMTREALPAVRLPERQYVVSVQGAVLGAGVYEFTEGQRVNEAVEAAGGLLTIADTSGINLAAKLVDATTLYIPKKRSDTEMEQTTDLRGLDKNHPGYILGGGTATALSEAGAAITGSGLINLNTASQAQLESLPGIGPVYAQAIIEYRSRSPFQRVEEIQEVSGIGAKRFESIRDAVTVR